MITARGMAGTRDLYSRRYAGEQAYWGVDPNELVVEAATLMRTNGRVLDLGSGEGRDSAYLAKNGFRVTAVDFCAEGVRKTRLAAREAGVQLEKVIQADLTDTGIISALGEFDGILAMGILHHLSEEAVRSTLRVMKRHTTVGGHNVIWAFVGGEDRRQAEVPSEAGYLFGKGEMRDLYSDWKVCHCVEGWGPMHDHGEGMHRHHRAELIAQRRG